MLSANTFSNNFFRGFVDSGAASSEYTESWQLKQTRTDKVHEEWTGSRDVVVAVLDTEFNLEGNTEILNNVWINQDEIPASIMSSLVDVDDDGLISFADLNASQNAGAMSTTDSNSNDEITIAELYGDSNWQTSTNDNPNGDNAIDLVGWDARETHDGVAIISSGSHGSNAARVIAGIANNSSGIGAAPRVLIMPIRVDDTLPTWHRALDYVLDQKAAGVDIAAVSISVAITSSENGDADDTFASAAAKVRQLAANGIAYVDAAGNDSTELTQAAGGGESGLSTQYITPWLDSTAAIVVGGTGDSSTNPLADPAKRANSNYGLSKDVVWTPQLTGIPATDWFHGVDIAAPAENVNGSYDGTSFAAPQVAAAVALLSSRFPDMPVSAYSGEPDPDDPSENLLFTTHEERAGKDICNLPNEDHDQDPATPDTPTTPGIVEYILCGARQFTLTSDPNNDETFGDLFEYFDHGFLHVQNAYDLAVAQYDANDLNADGTVNASDIDFLYAAVRVIEGQDAAFFDFDDKGTFNHDVDLELADVDDRVIGDVEFYLIHMLAKTFGDSNMDGIFDSQDLVFVFNTNEFEDGVDCNSTWVDGDWNGDQEFDQIDLDFVEALGTFTYE
ncbi:MAG: S8 family serine peptidase [Planctomycetales bacterium]|nr:S8 family serine peptidase [Planctomycetales bacterium]